LFVLAGAASAREPDIVLTETGGAHWRLEYRLDAPARSLRFTRSLGGYRDGAWRPADKAFVISADGSSIRRADGRPFQSVAYDVDAKSLGVTSNYEPVLRFSDGGMLLYTGYYFACADAPCTASASWRISVDPMRRKRATRGAPASPGTLQFSDKGDGSYVYVGSAKPVETASYMALVDPALPAGVVRSMNDSLPRVMDYYRKRLGRLPRKPAFFVSLGAARSAGGYESRGSALPDQVSIHLAGPRWSQDRGAVEPGFLPWYFAHEAAHLHQRIEDRPIADDFMAEGWIHEGGAEALAALTVSEVEPSLKGYVEKRIAQAAQDCDEALRDLGAPLNASIDHGASDNYYVCGLAMQMAVDRDVRAASSGRRDLFHVWRAFLDATGRGESWNEATFLRAARAQGAREDTLQLVSSLARKRPHWAEGAVKERLLAAPADRRR
jgi:hypothetical protein